MANETKVNPVGNPGVAPLVPTGVVLAKAADVKPAEVKKEDKPVVQTPAGFTQPASQNIPKPEVVTATKEDRVPVSIQGHRRVPADPYDGPGNPAYTGDAGAKPKTQEQLAAEIKNKK